MKIYKVTLDPSNPIQQLVKIPAGSDYGIQINWDYEKYPKFVGTDVDTNTGKLYLDDKVVNTERIKDIDGTPNPADPLDTIYKDGQQTLKIDYNKKLENVGDFVVYKYTNNADSNGLGTIKVIAVDTSTLDYDNEGLTYSSIKETNTFGNQTITIDGNNQAKIKSTSGRVLIDGNAGVNITGSMDGITMSGPTINLTSINGEINIGTETDSSTIKLNGCTIQETITTYTGITYPYGNNGTILWNFVSGYINFVDNLSIGEAALDTYININPLTGTIDINATTLKLNGTNIDDIGGAPTGIVDGLFNVPVQKTVDSDTPTFDLNLSALKTVYKVNINSDVELSIHKPDSDVPANAIMTFWLWLVMEDDYEVTFPSVTFIDNPPALTAYTETMLALTSTDGGTTWLANTQWVK